VVADAVDVEPVSKSKFPAKCCFAGKYPQNNGFPRILVVKRRATPMLCGEIPYLSEQGIFLGWQGAAGKS
jgi:hypothetical protein